MPRLSNRNIFFLLAAIWLVVQAMLLYSNNIGTTNEAEKYIGQAYHLQLEHRLDDHKYIFYFLPILIIYTGLTLRLGFAFVIVIQLVVNAVATVLFYKIANCLFNSKGKSVLATLLYATFIPLQAWNSYLYTESLFYSLCIFFMYAYIVMPNSKPSTHIIRAFILVLLVFTRPLGLLFIPVACVFYFSKSNLPKTLKWLTLLVTPCILYVLINFLYTSNADMDILMPQKDGMVICYGGQIFTDNSLVTQSTQHPLNDLTFFICHNPIYFSKLAGARLLSFFNLYRADYSIIHNVYLVICMVLLYGGFIVSAIKSALIKHPAFTYLFLPLLVILCIGVMLQCDDYNSRFSMPLFPWIILLAIDGMFIIRKNR